MTGTTAAPTRLLYVQPGDGFGGTERQAATVIPLLAQHGLEVTPLIGPGRILADWLRRRGVSELLHSAEFPKNRPDARGLDILAVPFRYARARRRIADLIERTIRERGIDLVYAALPFGWVSATDSSRRCAVPIVWRAGTPQIYAGGLGQALFSFWARRHPPDLVICSADSVQARYRTMVPAPMAVVRNGVDRTAFAPAPVDARCPGRSHITVGFAARLVAPKGIADLLEVAARMRDTAPEVTFLIAGEGPRRPEYEALAALRGADRNTRFLGYVDDMRGFYHGCDVFVLPSRSEGCSNVLLEAMGSGCAVVATDIAGIREIAVAEDSALLVPVGDIDALHTAILRLSRDGAARRALRERALRRIATDFDLSTAVGRLAALLHSVVAAARAAGTVTSLDMRHPGS